jgi:hypothetical protein
MESLLLFSAGNSSSEAINEMREVGTVLEYETKSDKLLYQVMFEVREGGDTIEAPQKRCYKLHIQ